MEWIYGKGIPIEAQYLYRKGVEMESRGDHHAALVYFGQAVLLAPEYAKAIFEMGNCFACMGRYEEAMVKYRRAAGMDPCLALPSGYTHVRRPGSGIVEKRW